MHGDERRFIPGGESGSQVLTRYREALQAIADQHRGETVARVQPRWGDVLRAPERGARACAPTWSSGQFLPNCGVAEVEVDGDGFRVLTWPGSRERGVV